VRDYLVGRDVSVGMLDYGDGLYEHPIYGEFVRLTAEGAIDPIYPGLHVEIMDEVARRGRFQC
jgi:hypothetical protein